MPAPIERDERRAQIWKTEVVASSYQKMNSVIRSPAKTAPTALPAEKAGRQTSAILDGGADGLRPWVITLHTMRFAAG